MPKPHHACQTLLNLYHGCVCFGRVSGFSLFWWGTCVCVWVTTKHSSRQGPLGCTMAYNTKYQPIQMIDLGEESNQINMIRLLKYRINLGFTYVYTVTIEIHHRQKLIRSYMCFPPFISILTLQMRSSMFFSVCIDNETSLSVYVSSKSII